MSNLAWPTCLELISAILLQVNITIGAGNCVSYAKTLLFFLHPATGNQYRSEERLESLPRWLDLLNSLPVSSKQLW